VSSGSLRSDMLAKDENVSFELAHTERFCTCLVAIPRPGPAHINQTMPLRIVQRSRPRGGSPIVAPRRRLLAVFLQVAWYLLTRGRRRPRAHPPSAKRHKKTPDETEYRPTSYPHSLNATPVATALALPLRSDYADEAKQDEGAKPTTQEQTQPTERETLAQHQGREDPNVERIAVHACRALLQHVGAAHGALERTRWARRARA
jgi:hypothetical protein